MHYLVLRRASVSKPWRERGWTNSSFQGIGILSLAIFLYVVAELVGGNGFIAAFVGGMVFGPRSLASILSVLLILEESDVPHREELLSITVITVALSALLHGISAAPLASLYGRFANRMGECQRP